MTFWDFMDRHPAAVVILLLSVVVICATIAHVVEVLAERCGEEED